MEMDDDYINFAKITKSADAAEPIFLGISQFILRLPAVKAATGLCRSTIYKRISQGTFPAPVSLGGSSVGWAASDIEAWIQSKLSARPAKSCIESNSS
ncbi:MAG: AlpA family transcriptional regulator [Pseudomonadota bacterium]